MIAVSQEPQFTPFGGTAVVLRGMGQEAPPVVPPEERGRRRRPEDAGPPGFVDRPGVQLPWGLLKKREVPEILKILDVTIEEMENQGIPPGILKQIEAKLVDFEQTAPPDAEIELSSEEIEAVEHALMLTEGAGLAAAGPSPAVPIVIVGAAGLAALLFFV